MKLRGTNNKAKVVHVFCDSCGKEIINEDYFQILKRQFGKNKSELLHDVCNKCYID